MYRKVLPAMTPPPPDNITIRLATILDEPLLSAQPLSTGLPDKHHNRIALQSQGHMEYILALQDDTLIGHLLLKWNGPEDPFLKRMLPPCAEIEDFMVAEEWQGRGIGSAMLEFAAARAREHGETRLGLSAGIANERARALYDRHGFVVMPGSEHRVRWFEPNPDGTSRIAGEDCDYLMKDLL